MSENTVKVRFRIAKDADGFPEILDWEELTCAEREGCFEVRSVPFYLKTIAYGDLIVASANDEGHLEFSQVKSRSGYSVFRLLLRERGENLIRVLKDLVDLGLVVEWEGSLVAIAVPPDKKLDEIVAFILSGKNSGRWGAQDGFIFGG